MASAEFSTSYITPLLKKAIKNIKAFIKVEETKVTCYSDSSHVVSEYYIPRNKLCNILNLCNSIPVASKIYLTAEEYNIINYWADEG